MYSPPSSPPPPQNSGLWSGPTAPPLPAAGHLLEDHQLGALLEPALTRGPRTVLLVLHDEVKPRPPSVLGYAPFRVRPRPPFLATPTFCITPPRKAMRVM